MQVQDNNILILNRLEVRFEENKIEVNCGIIISCYLELGTTLVEFGGEGGGGIKVPN